jgi:hypothetical protein
MRARSVSRTPRVVGRFRTQAISGIGVRGRWWHTTQTVFPRQARSPAGAA